MDKNSFKDNILRECYYHQNDPCGCGYEDFHFGEGNTLTIKTIIDELEGYIVCKYDRYYITDVGLSFVTSDSFSFPGRPIVFI